MEQPASEEAEEEEPLASTNSKRAKLASSIATDITERTTPSSTGRTPGHGHSWRPVNSFTTWAACLNVVQELQRVHHNVR